MTNIKELSIDDFPFQGGESFIVEPVKADWPPGIAGDGDGDGEGGYPTPGATEHGGIKFGGGESVIEGFGDIELGGNDFIGAGSWGVKFGGSTFGGSTTIIDWSLRGGSTIIKFGGTQAYPVAPTLIDRGDEGSEGISLKNSDFIEGDDGWTVPGKTWGGSGDEGSEGIKFGGATTIIEGGIPVIEGDIPIIKFGGIGECIWPPASIRQIPNLG